MRGRHGGAAVSAVASQSEGCWFDSRPGAFPRGVSAGVLSLSLSVGVRASLSASGYWKMDGLDENSEVVSSAVVTKTQS